MIIMRKSPTFNKTITCSRCFNTFQQTGNNQIYCADCRVIVTKESKRKSYMKNNPNAYSPVDSPKTCSLCNLPFSSSYDGVAYCNKHYLRMYNNGSTEIIGRKKNDYVISGDSVIMTTNQGVDFIFDLKDLDKVRKYSWCLSRTGYLVANINGKVTKLHRYILDAPSNFVVDHINRDPKDNRLINLRLCSTSQNNKNTSLQKNNKLSYPGIRKTKHGKFNVRITCNRSEIHVGNYETFEEAVSARKQAEVEYFGEFAPSLGGLKKY